MTLSDPIPDDLFVEPPPQLVDDLALLLELPMPPEAAGVEEPSRSIMEVGVDRIGVESELTARPVVAAPPPVVLKRTTRVKREKPPKTRREQAAYSEAPSDNIHVNTPDRELEIVRAFAPIGLDPASNPTSTVNARVEFWGPAPTCSVCGQPAAFGILSTLRAERCETHREEREPIPADVLNDARYGKDGLALDWKAHLSAGKIVFLQPPYGRFIVPWIAKANAEAARGVEILGLLPGRYDTKWFNAMRPARICWYKRRIPYVDHSKPDQKDSAKFPSVFVLWSERVDLFVEKFAEYGKITAW